MASLLTIHEGRTDVKPEQVGLDSARLEVAGLAFWELIEKGELQGASYLVSRNEKIVLHKSQGKLTYHENSSDLSPDSIRKVYSITKVITAVAIIQLCEEGKLYLQQPVSTLIAEFDNPIHRSITIWHLLTHTSGLRTDPGVLMEPYSMPWYEWWAREKKQLSEAWGTGDWVKYILSGQLLANPGEQWNYSTAGFAILGEIISRASGKSYEDYIHEKIAGPLGMGRSFFAVPEKYQSEACFTGAWEEKDIFTPFDRSGMPPQGGNGYHSTLEDLWRFGQMVLDGGIFRGVEVLGRRSVQAMVSNQLKNVTNRCWGANVSDMKMGIGWSLNHEDICTPGTFSHEGYAHSGLYVDPHEQLVFVYFGPPAKDGWIAEAVINPRAIVWSSLR